MPCNWPSDVIILEAAEMAAVAFGKTACLAFLENEVVGITAKKKMPFRQSRSIMHP